MTVSQRERNELRSMIRARFKALRAGVEQRRSDQHAEIERQINARYDEQDRLYREAAAEAARIAARANAAMTEVFAPIVGDRPEHGAYAVLMVGKLPDLGRTLIRERARREVDAAAKKALYELMVAEAGALEAVARTAIESDEAHQLMAEIPTIDMLMPMVELPSAAADTVADMADPLMPWRDTWAEQGHALGWKKAQAALSAGTEDES